MERVLIVAKTRMGSTAACVGGLTRDTNKSIRLLRPGGSNQPINTNFDVGQVWELEFHQPSEVTPPHVEDIIVTNERYVGQSPNLRSTLMHRVQPWQGGPNELFDGLLVFENTSSYISKARGIPKCSTGYWLPDDQLTLSYRNNNKPYYQIKHVIAVGNSHSRVTLSISYVGFADPIQQIPTDTLVRVSLARWWTPSGASEERCYLQLSGWYL